MMLYILITFSLVFFIYRYTRADQRINKIPGPTPYLLIGNLMEVHQTPEKLWNLFRKCAIAYRPIAKIWLGFSALIITIDPDDAKVALSSKTNINKGFFYKHLKMFLKDGLITSNDKTWQQRRRLLNNFFHINNLKQTMKVMNKQALKMVEQIKSEDPETVQSLIPLMKKMTLNIICESTMNIDLDSIEVKEVNEYRNALDEFLEFVVYRLTRPYLTDWVLKFLRIGQKQKHNLKILHDFSNRIIQERRKYLQVNGYNFCPKFDENIDAVETEEPNNEKQNRMNVLDFLLLAEKDGVIDQQGVQDEINTLIAAGHDSSSMALVHALMLLAENKEAQDQARAEVFQVLNESGSEITDAEIRKLKYVERCVKESLRLFPSVPHIGRRMTEEMQLKNYTIPVGHDICVDIFDLQRNPKLWTNPKKFDPDRFLAEYAVGRHPFAYVPFGAGPRSCIGRNFSMMEMIIVITHILRNFKLEPIDKTADIKFKLQVVIAIAHPVHAKFINLNKS